MRKSCPFLLLTVLTTIGVFLPSHSLAADPPLRSIKESPAEPAEPRVRLLVPAYFYPAAQGAREWERLLAASERVPLLAIVNPASGPGKDADSNYVKIFERAQEFKHATLIGYVATSYARRSLRDVQAEVDLWIHLYPKIQGIFFDEQASGADQVAYQETLYRYVRETRALNVVVTNPGTVCAEQYFSRRTADVSCLFEAAKAWGPSAFPGWVGKYQSARVATLSYKIVTAGAMRQCIELAAQKNVGFCYVTDADGANPWERLPLYWDEEVAAARAANQQPVKK